MGDIILIFITGSKEYVFDAFDVSAFHYLLKPIGEQKFTEVFERAAEEVKKRKKQKQEHIVIKTKNRCLTLKKNSIRYIENKGRKLEIHTMAFKEALEIYATMDELAGQLGENFYRCHRGYLVNMAYIAEYGSDSIRLMGGEEIYLTRRKHGEFVKAYMWYLQNGGNSCV